MFLAFPQSGEAANIVWDGSGGDALWSTDSNWAGNTEPGVNDVAVFDGTCSSNCSPTIDLAISVLGISMNSGYASIITQSAAMTLGSSGFVVAAGQFEGGSDTITVNGTFSQTGGIATSTSGTMNVLANLTLTSGTFNHNSGIVNFSSNGGTNSALSCTGSPFNKITITKGNNAMTIGSGCNVPLGASPTMTMGQSTWSGTVTIDSGTWTWNGGTGSNILTNNGTITHNGDAWVFSNGGFTMGSSGVVTYSGTTLSIVGSLNIAQGTFPTGLTVTFTSDGNTNSTLTCTGSPFTKVIITKANNQMNISSSCTVPLGASPTMTIGQSTWSGTITIDSGTWTWSSGFAPNITNNGTITHNGTGWDWSAGGGLIMGSSAVVTYSGTTASFMADLNVGSGTFPSGIALTFTTNGSANTTLTCGASTFSGITLVKVGNQMNFVNTCTDTGNFTFTSGNVNNPGVATSLIIQGNFSQASSGTLGGSNLTLSMEGSTNTTISKSAGTFSSKLQINKTSTSTRLITALTTTGQTCTVASGTFDLNGNNFTCGSTFTVNDGTTLALVGSESSVTEPTLNSGSTVLYKGDGDGGADTFTEFKDWSYMHLTASTTDSADIIDASGVSPLTIASNFNLVRGTLSAPTTMNVAGNFVNTGGTLDGNSGTVVLNGTNQQVLGDTTFNNLTKSVAVADTLTFGNGDTTTVTGTMAFDGDIGALLSLRSDDEDTEWLLDPQGDRTIEYLDVQDSNNINGTSITVTGFNITDSGNNTGWGFPVPSVDDGEDSPALNSSGSSSGRNNLGIIQFISSLFTFSNQGTAPQYENKGIEIETVTVSSTGSSQAISRDVSEAYVPEAVSPEEETSTTPPPQKNTSTPDSAIWNKVWSKSKQIGKVAEEFIITLGEKAKSITRIGTLTVAPVILAAKYSISSNDLLLGIRSVKDLYYSLFGLMQGLLTSAGIRKRRRYWGTVYDSVNKQAIDPALVELIDSATNEVVEQSITDMFGRFGFLDRPGTFHISARKTHYNFPSKIVIGEQDGVFENVYHGEQFRILNVDNVLAPNIPMDAMARDWNQEEKQRIGAGKIYFRFDIIVAKILQFLFWSGFIGTLIVSIANPSKTSILFISIYLFLVWLNHHIPNPQLWGRVVSESIPLDGLSLWLAHPQIPNITVGKALTNSRGKFFLKVSEPGEYILTVRKIGEKTNTVILTKKVEIGRGMIMNETVELG